MARDVQGLKKEPTIILEAVASKDLWIWHAFFGTPGSHNDINVLQRFYIFTRLAEGKVHKLILTSMIMNIKMGYYLAYGIYPSWATFVKIIPKPQGNKKKIFCHGTRMLKWHLGFYNLVLLLFIARLVYGIKTCSIIS
jgi:hypothetical protein